MSKDFCFLSLLALISSLSTLNKTASFCSMAEEGIEKVVIAVDGIPVSPEIVVQNGGSLRRNSTGQAIGRTSLSSSSNTEKVLPHYLRASTGSCHDFCKYGREHTFEAKKRHPFPRKVMGEMETSAESQDQTKVINLVEGKKKTGIMLKETSEREIELPEKSEIVNKKSLTPVKKIEMSFKPAIASKQKCVRANLSPSTSTPSGVSKSSHSTFGVSKSSHSTNPSLGPDGRKCRKNNALSPSVVNKDMENNGRSISNPYCPSVGRIREKSIPSRVSLSGTKNPEKKKSRNSVLLKIGEKKTMKSPIASLSPKPSLSRVLSLKSVRCKNPKEASPTMNQNRARKAESSDNNIIEKTLYVIEPKLENGTAKPAEDETTNRSSQSSLSLSSLSSCPSLSSDEVEEEQFELEEHDNLRKKKQGEDSKGERRRLRRSVMIHPEEVQSQKFKFQRGKVVNPKPENDVPRRLKFRQGRVVGENQKSLESENGIPRRLKFRQGPGMDENQKTLVSENSGQRGLKLKQGMGVGEKQKTLESQNSGLRRLKFRQGIAVGVNQNSKVDIGRRSLRRRRDLGGNDVSPTETKTPVVVLKHQDMQSKKEEQVLFNDVIEETANKLVETRKSKVKALVGAFETVISLQERKPTTATC